MTAGPGNLDNSMEEFSLKMVRMIYGLLFNY